MSDQASTIMVNTLEPQSGTTLTVGKSGQNLQVNADSLKANVAKDAGANALFTSDGSGNISGLNSGFGSAQVLIQSQTFTDQATVSFTSGITSTYNEYVFMFYNINPASAANFTFQANASGQSGYDETITSSYFRAYHYENNSSSSLDYQAGPSQAQGTAFQELLLSVNADADSCGVGELHLFNPSSTTYVKNFYFEGNWMSGGPTVNGFAGGYLNTTSAITEIQFKMASGNFDGIIKMYGIK